MRLTVYVCGELDCYKVQFFPFKPRVCISIMPTFPMLVWIKPIRQVQIIFYYWPGLVMEISIFWKV